MSLSWAVFVLLLVWFGISVPLVFVGAFFGFKAQNQRARPRRAAARLRRLCPGPP